MQPLFFVQVFSVFLSFSDLSFDGVKKKKISFKEQKELDNLESKIANLESVIPELTIQLDAAYASGKNHPNVTELTKKISEKQKELDSCYEKWDLISSKNS